MKKHKQQSQDFIANEVARIIYEQGYTDYNQALKKVSQRYKIKNQRLLPDQQTIKTALNQYQQLFQTPQNNEQRQIQRKATLALLKWLDLYSPQATGAILEDNIGIHDAIDIFLKPEYPEQFIIWLINQEIEYQEDANLFLFARHNKLERPIIRLYYQGFNFKLTILDAEKNYQYPLDPISEQKVLVFDYVKLKQAWNL